MEPIPLNNETMKFNSEVYLNILKQRELEIKSEEEHKRKWKEYEKLIKPFRNEIENLRKEELEKLKTNSDFVKRCEIAKKNKWLTEDFHEQYMTGGCGGYVNIDLINEYGSNEYKKKVKEIHKKIGQIKIN